MMHGSELTALKKIKTKLNYAIKYAPLIIYAAKPEIYNNTSSLRNVGIYFYYLITYLHILFLNNDQRIFLYIASRISLLILLKNKIFFSRINCFKYLKIYKMCNKNHHIFIEKL